MMNTDVTTWMTAALSVFEQLHCGGAWYDFVLVVIGCLITRLVMSFILEVPSLRVCCSSPLSCRLFSGQNESASSLFFFLFILTHDKTHRLWGNWRRGSCFVLAVLSGVAINQVIYCVSEGPLSIEFMTCCKKQMLQRYWNFAGYIIMWHERATVKNEGLRFIMISPVYMSRGDPIGRSRSSDAVCITSVFSRDYSLQIMFRCRGSCKAKGAAQIIWHFPVMNNKTKAVMKHRSRKNWR